MRFAQDSTAVKPNPLNLVNPEIPLSSSVGKAVTTGSRGLCHRPFPPFSMSSWPLWSMPFAVRRPRCLSRCIGTACRLPFFVAFVPFVTLVILAFEGAARPAPRTGHEPQDSAGD